MAGSYQDNNKTPSLANYTYTLPLALLFNLSGTLVDI